jgi:hypothetical protein
MWLRARTLPKNSVETLAKCRGCSIGARHAGQPVAEGLEEAPDQARAAITCTRCGEGGTKIVDGRLCISCYNREREVIRGVNRRGNAPVRAKPLRPFAAVVLDDRVKRVDFARVTSGLEGILSVERHSLDGAIAGHVHPSPVALA